MHWGRLSAVGDGGGVGNAGPGWETSRGLVGTRRTGSVNAVHTERESDVTRNGSPD